MPLQDSMFNSHVTLECTKMKLIVLNARVAPQVLFVTFLILVIQLQLTSVQQAIIVYRMMLRNKHVKLII